MIARRSNTQQESREVIPSVEKESSSLVVQKKPENRNANTGQNEKNVIAGKQPTPAVISASNSDKTYSRQTNFQSVKKEPEEKAQNIISAKINTEKSTSDIPSRVSLLNTNNANPDSVLPPQVDSPLAEKQQAPIPSLKKDVASQDSVLLLKRNEPLTETSVANVPPVPEGKKTHPSGILSRFYVEGIFSPEITNRYLKDNNSSDLFTLSKMKEREANVFSHSEGIKFGYDHNQWSIQSGCIYTKQSLAIMPLTMYPYLSNGQFQCTLVTSSGTVDIPYSGSYLQNDSMTVKNGSHQTLAFLNIPLQLKYKFGVSKLSFYILSGVSANILIKEETNIKIGYGYADDDNKIIRGINGTKNVYYGYSLGVGASYLFRRGFYLSLEPALRGAMSSLNKNTPMKTYPYTLGFGVIAGYHF
jgi:hypothetical protein